MCVPMYACMHVCTHVCKCVCLNPGERTFISCYSGFHLIFQSLVNFGMRISLNVSEPEFLHQ